MGGKRSIISLIIVCLIGCMLCGCDKKQDTEKEIGKNAPKIVVGSDNYPPFNYMDENGNPTGIDVDIATEAFKRLGYRVEFVNIEWEDKKNLVENGDIDICAIGLVRVDIMPENLGQCRFLIVIIIRF